MDMRTARRGRNSGISVTGKDGCRQTGEDSFSAVLRRLMKARRMSAPRLADRSWLDSAYVWRLTKEEADILNIRVTDGRIRQPTRDAVIKLGLGLGLAFSRRGVEANHGRIYTRNLPDVGCVFTIDLPRCSVPALAIG